MNALEIYEGSDGDATKKFYELLQTFGPIGHVAMNLFRAQKCSARAKLYRGGVRGQGSYKRMAYERKSWSMGLLCDTLIKHGASLQLQWGWKPDHAVPFGGDASWVLYVELSTGQVSFHSPTRGKGPDFPGDWDQQHASAERIILFCNDVLSIERKLAL